MSAIQSATTSFVQDARHTTKSERFVAIQPSAIAEVLLDHGFSLASIKTGSARKPDRAHHQTTIARYRHSDALDIKGHSLDVVVRAPHLYGALTLHLGLFRLVCTNQWVTGDAWRAFDAGLAAMTGGMGEQERSKLAFERIRHSSSGIEQLNAALPRMIEQGDALSHHVRMMQARDVTPREVADLAQQAAQARLHGVENVTRFESADLLRVHRGDDRQPTLWNAANIVQENLMRFGLRYQTRQADTIDRRGRTQVNVRNQVTRSVNDASDRAIDLNMTVWDAASALLVAA